MGVAKMSFITNESLFRYSLVMSVVGALCNIGLNWVLIRCTRAKARSGP